MSQGWPLRDLMEALKWMLSQCVRETGVMIVPTSSTPGLEVNRPQEFLGSQISIPLRWQMTYPQEECVPEMDKTLSPHIFTSIFKYYTMWDSTEGHPEIPTGVIND